MNDAVLRACLALLVVLTPPARVRAQNPDDEARALYSVGEEAFSEGRYEVALLHFQRAHELSPRPMLLFNIGAAAERLRRDALALEAYEQYLALLPQAPNRRVVAARILLLRHALHVDSEPSASRGEPSGAVAPWVVVGVGASAVVLGAVFTGLGYADAAAVRDLPDGASWDQVSDEYQRAPRRKSAGFALLGIGTLAAVTGVVLALTGGGATSSVGDEAAATRVTAWVNRSSAGVVASGSF